VSVRRERLLHISKEDVVREGFPELSPGDFVLMFCRHMKTTGSNLVTRIEFKKV
jgi:hypothetical protein